MGVLTKHGASGGLRPLDAALNLPTGKHQLVQIVNPDGTETHLAYDPLGRRVEIDDDGSLGWSAESLVLGIRAGFRCEYCGRDLLRSVDSYDAWQIDHIHPSSRGGGDSFDNKAVACGTCNLLKRHTVLELASEWSRDRRIEAYKREVIEPRRDKKRARLTRVKELVRLLSSD